MYLCDASRRLGRSARLLSGVAGSSGERGRALPSSAQCPGQVDAARHVPVLPGAGAMGAHVRAADVGRRPVDELRHRLARLAGYRRMVDCFYRRNRIRPTAQPIPPLPREQGKRLPGRSVALLSASELFLRMAALVGIRAHRHWFALVVGDHRRRRGHVRIPDPRDWYSVYRATGDPKSR